VNHKVLEGRARFTIPSKGSNTGVVYIPADIVKDSNFPFQSNEEVLVRIHGKKLIIKRD
jgi:hypothetical protein